MTNFQSHNNEAIYYQNVEKLHQLIFADKLGVRHHRKSEISRLHRSLEMPWAEPAAAGATWSEKKRSETDDVVMKRLPEKLLCAETSRIYRLQGDEKRMKLFDVHHVGPIG